jgi:hypothetical protein
VLAETETGPVRCLTLPPTAVVRLRLKTHNSEVKFASQFFLVLSAKSNVFSQTDSGDIPDQDVSN